MATQGVPHAAEPDAKSGRQIRLGLIAVFLAGVVVQFYLAGRGVFRASSNFDAHKTVGDILHPLSFVIFIASVAIPATRNRVDIGLGFALFVLMTIQAILGDFKHPELGALHPVNGLLVLGAAAGIFSRDRRLTAASRAAPTTA
jgi:hypothetical protein